MKWSIVQKASRRISPSKKAFYVWVTLSQKAVAITHTGGYVGIYQLWSHWPCPSHQPSRRLAVCTWSLCKLKPHVSLNQYPALVPITANHVMFESKKKNKNVWGEKSFRSLFIWAFIVSTRFLDSAVLSLQGGNVRSSLVNPLNHSPIRVCTLGRSRQTDQKTNLTQFLGTIDACPYPLFLPSWIMINYGLSASGDQRTHQKLFRCTRRFD